MLLRQVLVVRQRHLAWIHIPVLPATNIESIIFESDAVLRLDDLREVVARAEYASIDTWIATGILIQFGVIEQLGLPEVLTGHDDLLIQFREVRHIVGSRICIVQLIKLIKIFICHFRKLRGAELLCDSTIALLLEVLGRGHLWRDHLLAALAASLRLGLGLARDELVPHRNLQSCIS